MNNKIEIHVDTSINYSQFIQEILNHLDNITTNIVILRELFDSKIYNNSFHSFAVEKIDKATMIITHNSNQTDVGITTNVSYVLECYGRKFTVFEEGLIELKNGFILKVNLYTPIEDDDLDIDLEDENLYIAQISDEQQEIIQKLI